MFAAELLYQAMPASPDPKRRPTLVLAEDHPAVARQLRRLLETEFEVVAQVADGDTLVAAARAHWPRIIVTDICMPGRSGLEAAEAIRAAGIPACLVFVSIHNERELVRRALSLGHSAFVHKLTAGEDLLPAVRAVLESAEEEAPS